MKISDKKLKKAQALYEAGKYEDALKACEKVLRKEYHNEDALTIEGNALYKLGRLEEAIVNWKTNAEFNNNEDAKRFLDKIDGDVKNKAFNFDTIVGTKCDVAEIRAEIQRELAASKEKEESNLIKELEEKAIKRKELKNIKNIDEVVEEDIIEEKTIDEPVVEVQKETNYDSILEHIENEPIKEFEKEEFNHKKLSEMKANEMIREIPDEKPKKDYKKPIIIACSIGVIALGAYALSSNINKSTNPKPNTPAINEEVQVPEHNEKLVEDLNLASSGKNYFELSTILDSIDKDKLASEDIDAYEKAYDVMKTAGVSDLYEEGLEKFKNKDYKGALDDLNAIYPYSEDNYLRPHILYFLGATSEKLDNPEKEIEYFKTLLKEFPHSDMYTPEVLYTLANYYQKNDDKKQAKKYAREIENKYPSSIYYNDTIKDIIYNK